MGENSRDFQEIQYEEPKNKKQDSNAGKRDMKV
jgi:hypothetical protein